MRLVVVLALVAGCGADPPTCPALDDTVVNAECTNGCVPVQLAVTGARTSNLVVAAGALAWLDHDAPLDRVMTVPLAGGTPVEVAQLRRIAGHATHLRTNGAVLAWNEGPTVYVDGRAAVTSTAFFQNTRFALDAMFLYVPQDSALDTIALADNALVASWALEPIDVLGGDAAGPLFVTCGGAFRGNFEGARVERISLISMCAVRIAKNAAYAFVNANIAACNVSGLVRIDPATGETYVMTLDDQIGSIAADDTHAYFVKPDGLFRVAVDGGKPARIIDGTIDSFALDGANIYVIRGGALLQITK